MELRHLKYFVAVAEWKGFREASRRLHIAQPAISQAVSNLEEEIGVRLLMRVGRGVRLTPEGEVFYAETLRTLAQSRSAVEAAQRAARGEVGMISVGFCGAATYSFLPGLIRRYRAAFPGVKLALKELTPVQQESAFLEGSIDVGFTRALSPEITNAFHTRFLSSEPFLAAIPECRPVRSKRMKIADLAGERFVLFHRKGSPVLYDIIIGLCNTQGFSPTIESEPVSMQTALSLVAADQGVSILPSCALNLRYEGVKMLRILPDEARVDLILAWSKESNSTVLKSFLDLVETNKELIESCCECELTAANED